MTRSPVEDEGIYDVTLLPALLDEGDVVFEDLAHVGDADLFRGGELRTDQSV
jgi:hypothetical protein